MSASWQFLHDSWLLPPAPPYTCTIKWPRPWQHHCKLKPPHLRVSRSHSNAEHGSPSGQRRDGRTPQGCRRMLVRASPSIDSPAPPLDTRAACPERQER